MIEYANVPRLIGTLVSSGKATLRELQTFYGMGDAYDLLEIVQTDSINAERMRAKNGKH